MAVLTSLTRIRSRPERNDVMPALARFGPRRGLLVTAPTRLLLLTLTFSDKFAG